FIADAGHSLTVRVPNPLFKDWLTKHYSLVLKEALAEVRRPDTALVFVAEGEALPVDTTAAAVDAPPEADAVPEEVTVATGGGLTPRYTFDTFIVGPSNQFAHAAC